MIPFPQKILRAIPLTPNDKRSLDIPVMAFRVGLAGDVHIRSGDNEVLFKNVAAGETVSCLVSKLYEDSSAQFIVGFA